MWEEKTSTPETIKVLPRRVCEPPLVQTGQLVLGGEEGRFPGEGDTCPGVEEAGLSREAGPGPEDPRGAWIGLRGVQPRQGSEGL